MSEGVIIIGAGVAGLTAADDLLAAGIECTVLEASGRLGGRIRHLDGFADFPIELGAEEIHGRDNFLLSLAGRDDFLWHRSCDDFIRLDGRLVSLEEASADPDMRLALDFIRDLGRFSGPQWTADEALNAACFPARTRHYLDSRLGVEHGTSLDRLGMRGFESYEKGWEARENNATVRGPYLDLFARLIQRVRPRVKCHSVVERIAWSEARPRVLLSDGEVLEPDALIVTVPLAVLQQGTPVFDPPLPQEKCEAISGIGISTGMKIILKFSSPFWPSNMYFLHTDGFLPQFWTPGHGRGGNANILTAFIGGTKAQLLKSQDPVNCALKELDRVFGNEVASRSFKESFVADWGAEAFIRGLYSHPLASTKHSHRASLAAPLEGKIFFAGEATDLHGHSGTVHGAVESGRRAAIETASSLRARSQNRSPRS